MPPTHIRGSHRAIVALAFALTLSAGGAWAQLRIEGQTFGASVQLADAELRLNGVGLRAVAWFKGYAAGLYLTRKAGTPAQVLAAPGPKRLELRMLQEAPAQEFVKAIERGVTRNTPESEFGALKDRLARFTELVASVGKVNKGDVVVLDSIPGRGLVFSINGVARGSAIAGEDFYAAVLKIFIGDKPVDAQLKAGLLGGPIA